MNLHAVRAIYVFEMSRTGRTLMQSIVSPVISTSLYFVVFGAAIGSRITEIEGVSYGAFIVPGLIMLTLLTQSVANASFGIYFPRFTGTIYELLSAPISPFEIVLGYVGAAATKSIILGLIILATATLFVPLRIAHPVWMIVFLVLTALTFSLLGFIIGIWADGFEKLQVVPLLIITPLTFLGGSFYSISVLPPIWQTVTLFNPVVYLVSGFRWSFYEVADVGIAISLLGFIIGIWADGFEKLQVVPLLIITPLTFLGGSFYSISVLPPIWQTVTLFNPVVYLVSGFRWSFYEVADVGIAISLGMTAVFLFICLAVVSWMFKTGYRLKS